MSASSVLSVIAPQYDAIANRNEFLSLAALQVNATWFGAKYDLAVAYMAAHLISLNPSTGEGTGTASGFITSKREGDLSVTYAKPSSGGASETLTQTSWGQQFIQLRDSSNFILGVTGKVENVS